MSQYPMPVVSPDGAISSIAVAKRDGQEPGEKVQLVDVEAALAAHSPEAARQRAWNASMAHMQALSNPAGIFAIVCVVSTALMLAVAVCLSAGAADGAKDTMQGVLVILACLSVASLISGIVASCQLLGISMGRPN